jgi:nucleotide-binding universal stress UspA family protein
MATQSQRAPVVDLRDEMLESVNEAIDKLTLQEAGESERASPDGRPPSQRFRHIAACYDATPGAEEALAWAEHLASIDDAKITLVSVAPIPRPAPQAGWTVGWVPEITSEIVRMQRMRQRTTESAAAIARDEGHDVESVVTMGGATREIIEFVKTHAPDLVVVGSRGGGPVSRVVLGSVAEGVLSRAPSSVLIARGRPAPRRILIATDGSSPSHDATVAGLRYAAATGAEVVVLHVFDYEGDPTKIPTQGFLKAVLEEMQLPQLAKITYALEVGKPAERILAKAKEEACGLIVIGAHGHGRVEGFLLGSVSHRVANASDASVLVIKRAA